MLSKKAKELQMLLTEWKIEWISDSASKKEVFICAKAPTEEQKETILKRFPIPEGYSCLFEVSPKMSTLNILPVILLQKGFVPFNIKEDSFENKKFFGIHFSYPYGTEQIAELIKTLRPILEKDGYFDGWQLFIEDKLVGRFDFKIINDHKNNLKRDLPITKDDIINLQIILNDPKMTWENFLKEI